MRNVTFNYLFYCARVRVMFFSKTLFFNEIKFTFTRRDDMKNKKNMLRIFQTNF